MTLKNVISIDGMGGDEGCAMVVDGLEQFARQHEEWTFLLHGDETALKAALVNAQTAQPRTTIRHTDKAVAMDEKPGIALKRGKGSSMWNAIEAVKKNEAAAAVSAGNTGALMAMSKLILRTVPGVHRPALCAGWPTPDGICAVLDLGADITADAEQLVEFAIMGEAFSRAVHHKDSPSIGLLNIGSEDIKGNDTLKEAAALMRDGGVDLRYVGFVEGNDISHGVADVVVTDGFTGNIALKSAEGAAKLMGDYLKSSLKSSFLGVLGAMIARPALKKFQSRMDPRSVNGAVFLGLNGVVVKSHGGTDGLGYKNAIGVAADMASSRFMEEIESNIKRLGQAVKAADRTGQSDESSPTEAAE